MTPAPESESGAVPNNLPRQPRHFIGREQALAECARLLGDTRLLTLTGVGGCGKTRLALRLAQRLLESYPDGVWFVDLAPLLEPDRVPLAAAQAMNLTELPGEPLIDTIARHFATRRALVVLDNCEHLISAVNGLVERLLGGSESVKLIATSREGLGIEDERLFAVGSLSLPSRDDASNLEAIESTEAVQLFVDRAQVVDAKFALHEGNSGPVAEICQRLDGIPLAIELAAARVKLLSVNEILVRLGDCFKLLTGGTRTALPRQQTLHATIDWSYDHLEAEEQRILRLLAVFVGGWSLAAATAVANEHADEFAVLELLGKLVDKSLVVVEHTQDGATRYALLEIVRQYADEKMRDAGEGESARARHLDYFLALAEEGTDTPPAEWIARIVFEQENLLAALRFCDHVEDGGDKGLRITGAVMKHWWDRGHFNLCREVSAEALARSGAEARTISRARVLRDAGITAYRQTHYEEAQVYFEEAMDIYRAFGDREGIVRASGYYGHVLGALGDFQGARQLKEEGLALARELDQPSLIGLATCCLAEHERYEGNLEKAQLLYEEALAIFRCEENRRGISAEQLNLASADIMLGCLDVARARISESVEITMEMPTEDHVCSTLARVTELASASGDMLAAARFDGATEGLLERMGTELEPVDEKFFRPHVERAQAALGNEAFEAAFVAGKALAPETMLAEARAWLASES